MNPAISIWGPAAFVVGGYLLGIFFQLKRLDDIRDLIRAESATLRAEVATLRAEVRGEINTLRAELKTAETRMESLIERNHSELLSKFADLDRRISHIEGERRIVQ